MQTNKIIHLMLTQQKICITTETTNIPSKFNIVWSICIFIFTLPVKNNKKKILNLKSKMIKHTLDTDYVSEIEIKSSCIRFINYKS